MALTSRISLLFFVLTSLQMASSTRFKITIPVDKREGVQARLAKRSGDACSDYELISDKSSLSYPEGFQHLRKPWDENPNTIVATSQTVTDGIYEFLPLRVPGLNGVTLNEVLDVLQQNGCLSFPYGGSVRDQFLDAPPADLDMETNCANETIFAICSESWGPSNCHRGRIVHIGNYQATDGDTDVIDVSNWNETFFGTGVALEYTTNSISYFGDGLNITIDITGHGIIDTCTKKIRIPVGVGDRQKWALNDDVVKVYRFWKLRAKDYTAIDHDTLSFIVSEAKRSISNNPEKFKSFYCKSALIGQWSSPTCVIPTGSCAEALGKKGKYDNVFELDLRSFWSDNVKALIEDLHCHSCSTAPGGEMCSGTMSTTPTTPSTTVPTTASVAVPTTPSIAVLWGVVTIVFLAVIQ